MDSKKCEPKSAAFFFMTRQNVKNNDKNRQKTNTIQKLDRAFRFKRFMGLFQRFVPNFYSVSMFSLKLTILTFLEKRFVYSDALKLYSMNHHVYTSCRSPSGFKMC